MHLVIWTVWAAASVATAAAEPPPPPFSTTPVPERSVASLAGCCSDPDVQDYGTRVDFASHPSGEEIRDQYRAAGVLVGKGATPLATRAMVRVDISRAEGCQEVLNGEPPFQGWEFMIFVDPVEKHWATVQKIGVDVGYCDQVGSCFLAAYDADGVLLESRTNDHIGFQFLGIERESADISQILVGDCVRAAVLCSPDPAGSALNCLSFSPPVSTGRSLPDTVQVPGPPVTPGAPGLAPTGWLLLAILLSGVGMWAFRRRRAVGI